MRATLKKLEPELAHATGLAKQNLYKQVFTTVYQYMCQRIEIVFFFQ
jgi:hypothetical protein